MCVASWSLRQVSKGFLACSVLPVVWTWGARPLQCLACVSDDHLDTQGTRGDSGPLLLCHLVSSQVLGSVLHLFLIPEAGRGDGAGHRLCSHRGKVGRAEHLHLGGI